MFPLPPQFTTTPESIAKDAQHLIDHSRQSVDELVRNVTPSTATFVTVMLPLAHIENSFTSQANILKFYREVSGEEELRAASKGAKIILDDYLAESSMREDVFTLVDAVRMKKEELDQESTLYLQTVFDDCVRGGAALSSRAQKRRFKEIENRLGELKDQFEENVRLDNTSIRFTATELQGVPQNIINQLQVLAEEDEFEAILSNHSHMEIISYAEKAETRKRLFIACENRCRENTCLLNETLILRHERACLLGFPSHAAYQLKNKMARDPETVTEFLSDLQSRLIPSAIRLVNELRVLKKYHLQTRGDIGYNDGHFFLWDYEFYNNISRKQHAGVDKALIKEYFPVQTTITGMLDLLGDSLGLTFSELQGNDKPADIIWHEDVQVFRVQNSEKRGSENLGYLYLDLFRRPGKLLQTGCCTLHRGFTRKDGARHYPVSALLCDFAKPSARKPSLLRHFEAVVMFHELGHGIHDMVSKTRYSRFHGSAGCNIDFGELPSQFLEEWCWTPSVLKSLSFHYSYLSPEMLDIWIEENYLNTGMTRPEQNMPDTLIEAFIRSRNIFFGPLYYLNQCHRASFDMLIHQPSSLEGAKSVDLATTWNKLQKDLGQLDGPEILGESYTWGHGYCDFGHLMSNDYSAGYYSYLFSEVYSADLFYSRFSEDVRNSNQGQRYRECVLEKGGSQEPMLSIIDFLGRKPSAESFNKKLRSHIIE